MNTPHQLWRRLLALRPNGYTEREVLDAGVADGWAEAEVDPRRIAWARRQDSAAIPFAVIGGRPLNPCARTGYRRGRNDMGFWGENLMADALVTITLADGRRFVLLIEREDGRGWATPGGHVEPLESGLEAALRELGEEAGFTVDLEHARAMPARYVADPRSSNEAWAVTIPVSVHLTAQTELPALRADDDAKRALWIPAPSYSAVLATLAELGGTVFPAHATMLRELLEEAA